MLFLCGFELYSRWVPLKVAHAGRQYIIFAKDRRFQEKTLLAAGKSEGILWKLEGCKFMKC